MLSRKMAALLPLLILAQPSFAATHVEVHFTIVEVESAPVPQTNRYNSAKTKFDIEGDEVTDNNAGYVTHTHLGQTWDDDKNIHNVYRTKYFIENGKIVLETVFSHHHREYIKMRLNRDGTCTASVQFLPDFGSKIITDVDSKGSVYEDSALYAENIVCVSQQLDLQS